MAERRLIALVASLALLAVAFVMLGPGRARPVPAARLYGGPMPEGASQTSFRVVVFEEEGGFRAKLAGKRLRAMAEAEEARALWEGASGPDGSAEVRLDWDRAPSGPVLVRLTDEEGRSLAEGELPRELSGWGEGEAWPAEIEGTRTGELEVRAATARGVLAAPFGETIVVEASREGLPAAHAKLTITAHGARLASRAEETTEPLELKTDARGRASFELVPLSHDPELVVEATLEAAEGRLSARLPVLPGAMWLDPEGEPTRRIVSPVARRVAYLAIATPRERLFGAAVPLVLDGRGQAEGVLDLSGVLGSLRSEPGAMLTIASSEDFEGAGTVAWPLWADHDPFAFVARPIKDVLLLDGLPEARALEVARRKRAAAWAGGALGVAAVVEAFLLYRAARRGRSTSVEDEIDEALAFEGDARRAGLTLALAIAVTMLALAAVGVVVLLRAAATG